MKQKNELTILNKRDSTVSPVSYLIHPEEWEAEAELIYNKDWQGLLKYRKYIARERPDCIEEQWKLCDSYIDNGLYENALNYLSILYNEDPSYKGITCSIIEVLLLLELDENDFKWINQPKILQLDEHLLDTCYQYMKSNRKPCSIDDVYWHLRINSDFLTFGVNNLLMLIKQDNRFLVGSKKGFALDSTDVYINRKIKNKNSNYDHYCWCCERLQSNEKFSGKNHGSHLCKKCSKLDQIELKFRQTKKNIQRLIGDGETIIHRNRKALEKYINHKDKRISNFVQDAFTKDKKQRLQWKLEEEKLSQSSIYDDCPF